MKCDRMAELLPDYLQEDLSHEQADQVEEHLELCAKCREEVALWRNLAMIPEEQPSPMLRARFTAMLDAYQHGQSEESGGKRRAAWMGWMLGGWLRPAATFAMALLLLAVGFFAGKNTSGTIETRPQDIAAIDAMMYWLDDGNRPDASFFTAPGFLPDFVPEPWPW